MGLSARARVRGFGINKVVLPEPLFKMAVRRGRATHAEVGFFMIGLVRRDVAYIYDLVEFDYEEKSPVLVRSGLDRKLRLVGALPIGLRLIGNMHKHLGAPIPSRVDEDMFLKYARGGGQHAFVIYTVDPEDARAFTVRDGRVIEIGCEVRALEEDEELSSIRLRISLDVRACFPKSSSIFELKLLLANALCRELEKQVGLPKMCSGEEEISDVAKLVEAGLASVRSYMPVDVEASWSPGLFYRFYVDEGLGDKELIELVKKALGQDIDVVGQDVHEGIKFLRVQREDVHGGDRALEGPAEEGGDEGPPPPVPPDVLTSDMERLSSRRSDEEDRSRLWGRGPRGCRSRDIGQDGHKEDNNS